METTVWNLSCQYVPNRKSGIEVDVYFRGKYSYQVFDKAEFQQVCEFHIMENYFSRKELPEGILPDIKGYWVDEVIVGINWIGGEIYLESEEVEKIVTIHDDLFVFRGLDCEDLKKFFWLHSI